MKKICVILCTLVFLISISNNVFSIKLENESKEIINKEIYSSPYVDQEQTHSDDGFSFLDDGFNPVEYYQQSFTPTMKWLSKIEVNLTYNTSNGNPFMNTDVESIRFAIRSNNDLSVDGGKILAEKYFYCDEFSTGDNWKEWDFPDFALTPNIPLYSIVIQCLNVSRGEGSYFGWYAAHTFNFPDPTLDWYPYGDAYERGLHTPFPWPWKIIVTGGVYKWDFCFITYGYDNWLKMPIEKLPKPGEIYFNKITFPLINVLDIPNLEDVECYIEKLSSKGLFFRDGTISDEYEVNLEPGEEFTFETGPIFGFGILELEVKMDDIDPCYPKALVFGNMIYILEMEAEEDSANEFIVSQEASII